MDCIIETAKKKGLTIEQFINESQEYGYSQLNVPLGINGSAVYPPGSKTIEKKGDFYVPDLEVMTGFNYTDRETKSGRDKELKIKYKVPDAPIGWWVSEKFDGQRAIWDGQKFVSRGASGDPRVYPYVPRWFMACMPPGVALDGELFLARNSFSQTTSILKTKLKTGSQKELDNRWVDIEYRVFDVIVDALYEERKELLKKIVEQRCEIWKLISVPFYLKKPACPLIFTEQFKIKSEKNLMELYDRLVSEDAEGVMIRAPGIPYIPRRTKLMLKMKLIQDSECVIMDYKQGEGKYQGVLGSFYCRDNTTQKMFYVGGMNDSIRKNYNNPTSEYYHPRGTLVTYTFNGLTNDGIPRHPRYKGIRYD